VLLSLPTERCPVRAAVAALLVLLLRPPLARFTARAPPPPPRPPHSFLRREFFDTFPRRLKNFGRLIRKSGGPYTMGAEVSA
jgi:hypothetical protein